MKNSKVEWTDHTFNAWEGCTKVSPGCAHCYAEARNNRYHAGRNWGPEAPRLLRSDAYWREPLNWNRKPWICEGCGRSDDKTFDHSCTGNKEDACHTSNVKWHRARVFCSSLSDWLDEEGPIEQFVKLLELIHTTQNLDWLLLSKRPQNFESRLFNARDKCVYGARPMVTDWMDGNAPTNVWIGTTVEDQQRADERIPELLKIPAKVRFLSCEPLLGLVRLQLRQVTHQRECECAGTGFVGDNGPGIRGNSEYHPCEMPQPKIHWVICGGESGQKARPMDPGWARSLRDQCQAAGVPFFFKQWGEWVPREQIGAGHGTYGDPYNGFIKVGKKAAGRELDGCTWNEFPEVNS